MRRDDPLAAPLANEPELPFAPEQVIAALSPLLTDQRKERIERVLAQRLRSVVPVLDGLRDPHNVAAILRSADAFGVQEVQLVHDGEPYKASQRVTQGTDRWLDLVQQPDARTCIEHLHARGFCVLAATLDGTITPDQLASIPKLAVVLGNEHSGPSTAVLDACDGRYTIAMRGFAESLNVSVAAAITLSAATRGRSGDLDAHALLSLRARFMWLSVPEAGLIVQDHLERSR
jgi:tRNA (guanosine-2'-O-)-methyltransferase